MTNGWVIFANETSFNAQVQAENLAQSLPKKGKIKGVTAPESKQKTENVTECFTHPNAPTDQRVIAYINGGWRESKKNGFTFLTIAEAKLEGFFPDAT